MDRSRACSVLPTAKSSRRSSVSRSMSLPNSKRCHSERAAVRCSRVELMDFRALFAVDALFRATS